MLESSIETERADETVNHLQNCRLRPVLWLVDRYFATDISYNVISFNPLSL